MDFVGGTLFLPCAARCEEEDCEGQEKYRSVFRSHTRIIQVRRLFLKFKGFVRPTLRFWNFGVQLGYWIQIVIKTWTYSVCNTK